MGGLFLIQHSAAAHIQGGQHALVAAGGIVLQCVAVIIAQIHPGQHRAISPAVDHILPIVSVILGQGTVQVGQCAGGFLEASRVRDEHYIQRAAIAQVGAQPGDTRHLVVGIGVVVLGVKIHGVTVDLHHNLAITVQVGAVGRQRILQGSHGVSGQVVLADVADLHVRPGLEDGILDEPRHHQNGHHHAQYDELMIVPPVLGLFLFGVFLRRFGGMIVLFYAVFGDPCHGGHAPSGLESQISIYYNT